jgi:hypothetical protein
MQGSLLRQAVGWPAPAFSFASNCSILDKTVSQVRRQSRRSRCLQKGLFIDGKLEIERRY